MDKVEFRRQIDKIMKSEQLANAELARKAEAEVDIMVNKLWNQLNGGEVY